MRLLVLLLALAAGAAAQVPTGSAELALSATLPAGLRPGAVEVAQVEVRLLAENLVCAQAARLRLTVEVDDAKAAEGVVLQVENATSIPLPLGVTPRHEAAATPNASLLVARYAAPGSTSSFTVHVAAAAVEPATACTLEAAGLSAQATATVRLAEIPPGDPAFHPEHEVHGGVAFDKVLKPGETFTWTPADPGRYPYHDHFRPESKGLIRVLREAVGASDPVVRITAQGFVPSDLAVKVGTAVTWRNEDSVARTVSADEQHEAIPRLEPEDAALRANASASPSGQAPTPALPVLLVAAGLAAAAGLARRR